jgi:alanyl aminopeptidase
VADLGEDKELQAQAVRLARLWLADRRALDPDTVESVLAVAAAHGDRALFEQFREEARKAEERVDRVRLLRALGSFRDPESLSSALSLVLSDQFDPRESIEAIWRASGEAETRNIAYDFVKQKFEALVKRLPRDSGAHLPGSASGYCDRGHQLDVEAFFKDRSTQFTGGPRRLAQALEQISLCTALQQAQQSSVTSFFQKSNRPVASTLQKN